MNSILLSSFPGGMLLKYVMKIGGVFSRACGFREIQALRLHKTHHEAYEPPVCLSLCVTCLFVINSLLVGGREEMSMSVGNEYVRMHIYVCVCFVAVRVCQYASSNSSRSCILCARNRDG